MSRLRLYSLLVPAACLALAACERDDGLDPGEIDWESKLPPTGNAKEVPPYEGDSEIVQEAQDEYPTGLDFHQKVIWRTCTPNEGVCHNSKEYPDLRTPGSFSSAFGAACNVQPGEWEAVFDGCERPGDRVRLDNNQFGFGESEIAWIEYIAAPPSDDCNAQYPDDYVPTSESPGLHIKLRKATSGDSQQTYGRLSFTRTFITDGVVQDSDFASYEALWWVAADDPQQIVGRVCNYQTDDINELLEVGIVQGDMNRNGAFGLEELNEPDVLLRAGEPEESYLIARVRGSMRGAAIPGTPMPLANQPLSNSEMLAFFCLVEGFDPADPIGLSAYVDYNSCSYSANPENLDQYGSGTTWTGRVSKLIRYNCASCHSGEEPAAELNLFEGEVGLDGVYQRLFEASAQVPTLNLIAPNAPMQSYLYLKLIGHESIDGAPMPYNPLTGKGALAPGEIDDIRGWIEAGATAD